MAETERYNVTINGRETTLNLTAEDAKQRGLTDKDKAKAAGPADNKARTPDNKGR